MGEKELKKELAIIKGITYGHVDNYQEPVITMVVEGLAWGSILTDVNGDMKKQTSAMHVGDISNFKGDVIVVTRDLGMVTFLRFFDYKPAPVAVEERERVVDYVTRKLKEEKASAGPLTAEEAKKEISILLQARGGEYARMSFSQAMHRAEGIIDRIEAPQADRIEAATKELDRIIYCVGYTGKAATTDDLERLRKFLEEKES